MNRRKGVSQILWLILSLIGCAIAYIILTVLYAEILSKLVTYLNYNPPANYGYLDQLIFGFVYIFLGAVVVVFIIESYRKSKMGM